LKGHDELYKDVAALQSALQGFTVCLQTATGQITGILDKDDKRDGDCEKCKAGLEAKIEDINRWRWRIIGAISAVVGIPSIVSCIILLYKLGEGGLK
jgi:hypothetical protein